MESELEIAEARIVLKTCTRLLEMIHEGEDIKLTLECLVVGYKNLIGHLERQAV